MDNEEMNLAELLKQTAEENQTRKILAILEESESLEDAKEKVKALLNKQGEGTKGQHEGAENRNNSCHLPPSVFIIIAGRQKNFKR